jgi:hypothetical protein
MLSLHKINPMVRAIGTMGAVAGLVAGITFAQSSNTVALTNNTLTASSYALTIGLGGAGGGSNTTDCVGSGTTQTGFSATSLVPGGAASTPYDFCITNTGTTALAVSMTTPTNFSTSTIPASDVSLSVTCGTTTATPVLLSALSTPVPVDTSIAAGTTDDCSATASLSSGYTGNGGAITPFDLDFSGSPTT